MSEKVVMTFNDFRRLCRNAHTNFSLFLWRHSRLALFVCGIGLLYGGLERLVQAAAAGDGSGSGGSSFNDEDIREAVKRLLKLIEGSFGALIATAAGIGAVVASAFGGFKAAWCLLVCSVGAFILRSLISLFFGYYDGKDNGNGNGNGV